MSWDILITAGVVSAIISSLISFLGTTLTIKQQQKKHKFEYFFKQLMDIRRELYEIEEPDLSPMLARGYVAPSDMTVFLERFRLIDDIYFPNEMLFDKDLRKRADVIRFAVNRAITNIGEQGKSREIRGEKHPEDWDKELTVMWEKIVKYPSTIRDITDEQLDRLKI